jgi:hypothetical protein
MSRGSELACMVRTQEHNLLGKKKELYTPMRVDSTSWPGLLFTHGASLCSTVHAN